MDRFHRAEQLRPSILDPYPPFVRQTLEQHPRLRPQPREAFLRLQVFPAEQAQVDRAHFGSVLVGRAKRPRACFVTTLPWSRALYLEFFFDQTMENFVRGHVHVLHDWFGTGGALSLRAPSLPGARGKRLE